MVSQQQSAARVGRAAEYLFMAWLLLRHENVWVSKMPDASSVDLLLQRNGKKRVLRLQIKMTYTSKIGKRLVNLAKSDGSKYTPDEIDFLVAIDTEHAVFWILPVSLASKFGRITLDGRYSGYAYDWHDKHAVLGA